MGIFTTEQRRFAQSISDMVYCNPFVPERIDYDRQALAKITREGVFLEQLEENLGALNVELSAELAERLDVLFPAEA